MKRLRGVPKDTVARPISEVISTSTKKRRPGPPTELIPRPTPEDICAIICNYDYIDTNIIPSETTKAKPPPAKKLKRQAARKKQVSDSNDDICKCIEKNGRKCDHPNCVNRSMYTACPKSCGPACWNNPWENESHGFLAGKKTYLKYDDLKKYGVYAYEVIEQYSMIGEYTGELVDINKALPPDEEAYSFSLPDIQKKICPYYKGNCLSLVNHSCKPNCDASRYIHGGTHKVVFIALTDIAKDEELTFKYNWEYSSEANAKKCYCGKVDGDHFIGSLKRNAQRSVINNVPIASKTNNDCVPSPVARRIKKPKRSLKLPVSTAQTQSKVTAANVARSITVRTACASVRPTSALSIGVATSVAIEGSSKAIIPVDLSELLGKITRFEIKSFSDFSSLKHNYNLWLETEKVATLKAQKQLSFKLLEFLYSRNSWRFNASHSTSSIGVEVVEFISRLNMLEETRCDETLRLVLKTTLRYLNLASKDERAVRAFLCKTKASVIENHQREALPNAKAPITESEQKTRKRENSNNQSLKQVLSLLNQSLVQVIKRHVDTKTRVPGDNRIKLGVVFGDVANPRVYDALLSMILHGNSGKYDTTFFGVNRPQHDNALMYQLKMLYREMPNNKIPQSQMQHDKLSKKIKYLWTGNDEGGKPTRNEQLVMFAKFKSKYPSLDMMLLLMSEEEVQEVEIFLSQKPASVIIQSLAVYNAGPPILPKINYVISDRYTVPQSDHFLYNGKLRSMCMNHVSLNFINHYICLRNRFKTSAALGKSFVLHSSFPLHEIWTQPECQEKLWDEFYKLILKRVNARGADVVIPSFTLYNYKFYLPDQVLSMSLEQMQEVFGESGSIVFTCREYYKLPPEDNAYILACFANLPQIVAGQLTDTWKELLRQCKKLHLWMSVPGPLQKRVSDDLTTSKLLKKTQISFCEPASCELETILRCSVCTVGTDAEDAPDARNVALMLGSRLPCVILESSSRASNESVGVISSVNLNSQFVASSIQDYALKIKNILAWSPQRRNKLEEHLGLCVEDLPPFNCALQVGEMESVMEDALGRRGQFLNWQEIHKNLTNMYPAPIDKEIMMFDIEGGGEPAEWLYENSVHRAAVDAVDPVIPDEYEEAQETIPVVEPVISNEDKEREEALAAVRRFEDAELSRVIARSLMEQEMHQPEETQPENSHMAAELDAYVARHIATTDVVETNQLSGAAGNHEDETFQVDRVSQREAEEIEKAIAASLQAKDDDESRRVANVVDNIEHEEQMRQFEAELPENEADDLETGAHSGVHAVHQEREISNAVAGIPVVNMDVVEQSPANQNDYNYSEAATRAPVDSEITSAVANLLLENMEVVEQSAETQNDYSNSEAAPRGPADSEITSGAAGISHDEMEEDRLDHSATSGVDDTGLENMEVANESLIELEGVHYILRLEHANADEPDGIIQPDNQLELHPPPGIQRIGARDNMEDLEQPAVPYDIHSRLSPGFGEIFDGLEQMYDGVPAMDVVNEEQVDMGPVAVALAEESAHVNEENYDEGAGNADDNVEDVHINEQQAEIEPVGVAAAYDAFNNRLRDWDEQFIMPMWSDLDADHYIELFRSAEGRARLLSPHGQRIVNLAVLRSGTHSILKHMLANLEQLPAGISMVYSFVLRLQEYFQTGFPKYTPEAHSNFFAQHKFLDTADTFTLVHYNSVERMNTNDEKHDEHNAATVIREDLKVPPACGGNNQVIRSVPEISDYLYQMVSKIEKLKIWPIVQVGTENPKLGDKLGGCMCCSRLFRKNTQAITGETYVQRHRKGDEVKGDPFRHTYVFPDKKNQRPKTSKRGQNLRKEETAATSTTKNATVERYTCKRCGKVFRKADLQHNQNQQAEDLQHNQNQQAEDLQHNQNQQAEEHDQFAVNGNNAAYTELMFEMNLPSDTGVSPTHYETVSDVDFNAAHLIAMRTQCHEFIKNAHLYNPLASIAAYKRLDKKFKCYQAGQRAWTFMWLMDRVEETVKVLWYQNPVSEVASTGLFGYQVLCTLTSCILRNPLTFVPRLPLNATLNTGVRGGLPDSIQLMCNDWTRMSSFLRSYDTTASPFTFSEHSFKKMESFIHAGPCPICNTVHANGFDVIHVNVPAARNHIDEEYSVTWNEANADGPHFPIRSILFLPTN